MSPAMLQLRDEGLFATYREKAQAGLSVQDCRGEALFEARYPERTYASFGSAPTLLIKTLLYIENRDLFDPPVTRNPAIEWDRLGKAVFDQLVRRVDESHNAAGGSTLATQIEKYRHSPQGRTEGAQSTAHLPPSASQAAGGEASTRRSHRDRNHRKGARSRRVPPRAGRRHASNVRHPNRVARPRSVRPPSPRYVLDTQLFIAGFREPAANGSLQEFHRVFAPFEYLSAVVAQDEADRHHVWRPRRVSGREPRHSCRAQQRPCPGRGLDTRRGSPFRRAAHAGANATSLAYSSSSGSVWSRLADGRRSRTRSTPARS